MVDGAGKGLNYHPFVDHVVDSSPDSSQSSRPELLRHVRSCESRPLLRSHFISPSTETQDLGSFLRTGHEKCMLLYPNMFS